MRSRKSRRCAEAYFCTPHKERRRLTQRSRERTLALVVSLFLPVLAEAEPARRPVDFADLRLASVPLPGTHDERAVLEGPALEVFLSPSDFPDALLRLTLRGDAAMFAMNMDSSQARGEAVLSRVRWPDLGGRRLHVESARSSLPLGAQSGGRPPTPDELEAEDVSLELYVRPEETVETGRLVGVLRAARLASSDDRTLISWRAPPEPSGCGEAPEGRPRCRVWGVARAISSLSIHPSGRWMAIAGGDLRPRVDTWTLEPMTALRRVAFPPWLGPPLRAEFTPDGRSLIVADGAGTVHLWDADSGGGHRQVAHRARSFVLLDAGRLVATADRDGGLSLSRLRDGTVVSRMGQRSHGPSQLLAASGDGLRVAAVAYGEGGATIAVWEVEGGRVAGRVENAGSGFVDLALDATGEHVYASHDSNGLLRWAVGDRRGLVPWGGEPARQCRHGLAWSPDRAFLACAVSRGVAVLQAHSGELVHSLEVGTETEPPSALAFTPDGRSIIAASGGYSLAWDLPTGDTRGGAR